jgi:hypothetical protein
MTANTIVHDDCEVGFEEGMLWLPSYVLNEVSISRLLIKDCFSHDLNSSYIIVNCLIELID